VGASGKDKEFLILVDTGGGTYKAAAAAWFANGQKIPAIARAADGSATAVTTGPAVGIGTQQAAYLTAAANGKRVPDGIAPGPLTSQVGKSFAKSVKKTNDGHRWRGGVGWEARPQPVYALKTADGGALVVNVALQTESYTAVKSNVWFQPDPSYFGLGAKRFYQHFTGEQLWTFAIYVPSQGKASVLADSEEPVRVSGG
jgi:hypothetical protein